MIKDYKEGIIIKELLLIKDIIKNSSSNGNTYLSFTFQDRTGLIEGKKWNLASGDERIEKQKVYEVVGQVVTFKEKLQIKVQEINNVDNSIINLEDFIQSSSFSLIEMKNKLYKIVESIENKELNQILISIFKKYKDKFYTYPAASRNHHDYLRGLMEHTLSMCEVAEFMSSHYKNIDRDLLLSGCLLHDIGKVIELSGPVCTQYTVKGNLLGHLVIGENIIDEASKELNIDSEKILLLKHMIVSHHGKLEYGACVLPQTKEALLLSFIDDIDAKMNILDKAFLDKKEGEFSDKIFALDNKAFYIPKKDK